MNELNWDCKVSLFRNTLILKQLALAIGIPFGLLLVVLLLVKAYNGLILMGATFVLAFIIIMIVFKGTYDVQYVLNEKGILCQNQKKQRKRVQRLSAITFFLGLFKGNYSAAGIGLLSGAGTNIRIPWKRIKKVKYKEKQKLIMIHAGYGDNIALFCTDENYSEVKQYIENMRR